MQLRKVQRPEETALSQRARVSAASPMSQLEAVTGFWTMQEAKLGSGVLAAQAAMALVERKVSVV